MEFENEDGGWDYWNEAQEANPAETVSALAAHAAQEALAQQQVSPEAIALTAAATLKLSRGRTRSSVPPKIRRGWFGKA